MFVMTPKEPKTLSMKRFTLNWKESKFFLFKDIKEIYQRTSLIIWKKIYISFYFPFNNFFEVTFIETY